MASLLVAKARLIAKMAHKGQMRLQGEPYFTHPERLAHSAITFGFPDQVVAACYLHDVIEDCDVTYDDLITLLSDAPLTVPTADLVLEVTNVAIPSDGNRATRMTINRAHLEKSSPWGATIKCLDIADNLSSPFDDEHWARKYFKEKDLELRILKHADKQAWDEAYKVWLCGPEIVPKP